MPGQTITHASRIYPIPTTTMISAQIGTTKIAARAIAASHCPMIGATAAIIAISRDAIVIGLRRYAAGIVPQTAPLSTGTTTVAMADFDQD
jgi:hypothetical protein